jgi:zinc protease
MVVVNYPLGGSFNSRINLNLREAKGFTYGARSGISGTKYAGNWQFTASVKVNATDSALAETIKEITKFHKEGVTAQELDETKKSINQSQALRFETTNEKASFLSQMIRFNLSPDYLKQQQILLNALTVEELNNIIKKQLNPDDMDILIVGDANDIKKKIAALKLGAIQSFDHEKIKVPVLKY